MIAVIDTQKEQWRNGVVDESGALEAVLWRQGTHRCERWRTAAGHELRVYDGAALTHREPVRESTCGLQQAAALLGRVQAEDESRDKPHST